MLRLLYRLVTVTCAASVCWRAQGGKAWHAQWSFIIIGAVLVLGQATAGALNATDLIQHVQLYLQQGGIQGAAMLARYPAPGPQIITVSRTTTAIVGEPYAPICTARVFDPSGATVAVYEFSDQGNGLVTSSLAVANGPAGIWRVAVSGGRQGDLITFDLPSTTSWGIRGEMSIGQTSGAWNGPWWLWVPPTCTTMITALLGGSPAPIITTAAGAPLASTATPNNTLTITAPPINTTLQVTLATGIQQGVAFDGVPGLLCPTQAAAIDLAGGSILTPDGFMVAGPVQARVQAWMIQAAVGNLNPVLTFPTSVSSTPGVVALPQQQAQLYGQYAPLSSLASELPIQVLDVTSPNLGVFLPTGTVTVDWRTFLHGEDVGYFSPSGLAAAVACNGSLNPAYGNSALLTRATLSAFHHFVEMQGDDLMRDDDFRTIASPITYAFFTYPHALATPLLAINARLDPVALAIWNDGLIAVGDKLASYQGSESNQMAGIILGHLETYLATGKTQTRFLGYFERMATAFCTGAFGPQAKFGQHPAGYFLENYGPDGNYDSLSGTLLGIANNLYASLPEANPTVVATLHAALISNQAFKSYHWLPQPDGSICCATAFNCRADAMLALSNWPAEAMSSANFSLARRRWLMYTEQANAYPGTVMPNVINSDAWAIAQLQNQVPHGDSGVTAADVQAPWTLAQWAVCGSTGTASPASLPFESVGIHQVPGQVSWKLGGLYGNVFYDVLGANQILEGKLGGGPTELWTPSMGMVEASMRNANGSVITDATTLTHACVAGTLNGALFWTGTERSTLTWMTPNQHFIISGTTRQGTGTVNWDYQLANDAVEITATLAVPGVTGAYMNIPIPLEATPTIAQSGNLVTMTVGGNSMQISCPSGTQLAASLNAVPNPVTCVRVPLSGTTSQSASIIYAVAAVPAAGVPTVVVNGDGTVTVSGTGTPGLTVDIMVNGAVVGQATVMSGGSWSYVLTVVPSGTQALTVSNSDALGRTGQASVAVAIGQGGSSPVPSTSNLSTATSGGSGGGGCGLGGGAAFLLTLVVLMMRARLRR